MEVAIPIGAIWRLLTWLPSFMLRRVFTKARMSELVLFDVRPRYDPATVNLGKPASYELWLQITNISPFTVVLDQASFKFQCGVALDSMILEHLEFPTGVTKAFQISGAINEEQADSIYRLRDNLTQGSGAWLTGVMEFSCKLFNFSKNHWQLHSVRPRLLNENARAPSQP